MPFLCAFYVQKPRDGYVVWLKEWQEAEAKTHEAGGVFNSCSLFFQVQGLFAPTRYDTGLAEFTVAT